MGGVESPNAIASRHRDGSLGESVERKVNTMLLLTLLLGTLVGFSLGMTGGGGAIFAVPLLVYVLGIPTREAVGISLLTVGSTAMVGFLPRARHGLVEFPTGILFALAGMIGAPIGSKLADLIPEAILLVAFAFLMLLISVRMWIKAQDRTAHLPIIVVVSMKMQDRLANVILRVVCVLHRNARCYSDWSVLERACSPVCSELEAVLSLSQPSWTFACME